MKKLISKSLYIVAFISFLSSCQTNKQTNEVVTDNFLDGIRAKPTTEEFVNKMVSKNMLEIAMANLALMNSENIDIINLAKKISKDHEMANYKLKNMAESNNWEYPTQLLEKDRITFEDLKEEQVSSEQFDLLYLHATEDAHKASITTMEAFSNDPQHVEGTENIENEHLDNYSEDDDLTTEGENFDSHNTLVSDSSDYEDELPKDHGGVASDAKSDTTGGDQRYSSNTEGNTDVRDTKPTETNTNAGTFDNDKYTFEDSNNKATKGGVNDTNTPVELQNTNGLTLQSWVNQMLPSMKDHLKKIEDLHQQLTN